MIPLFAAVLPVVILFCGLSLDVGMLQLRRLQMQSAADAAALGAQLEFERGTNNHVSMAQQDAALNGFTNGFDNTTVSVQLQPQSGPYSGRYDTLQVTITQSVKTMFLGTLNGGRSDVTVQAAALLTPCGYFMGKYSLTQYSFYLASAGYYADCPMYASPGFEVDGFGNDFAFGNNIAAPPSQSSLLGSMSTPPVYNAATMTDPLAAIASPTFAPPCNHTSYTLTGGSATLYPGTYCKGITLSNSTLTLNPGLYIITGGINWNHSTVTGTGVTLFFTKGGGAGYGVPQIYNNSTIRLTAPTDTSYGGIPTILIFGDRNWIHTNPQDFRVNDSTVQGDGILYMTGTGLYFWNCGTLTGTNYFGMVADSSYFFATTVRPLMNFSNIPSGNPFRPLGGLVQ